MTATGPVWTEKARKMRIIDPLGTEGTVNRLQSRLLFPILSNAITHRLRYLSYWSWVTKHTERHTQADRALYEKVYLFANVAHDCSGDGTEAKGVVNASRTVDDDTAISDLYYSANEGIDISPKHFTLTNGKSGFDQYYKGLLYNLLLFENEQTLSPLGQELADAFDAAIGVSFDEVETAVSNEFVSTEFVDRFGNNGCLCLLSSRERELLAKAHFGLTNRAMTWKNLEFVDTRDDVTISVLQYLAQDKHEIASKLITDAEIEEISEDIDLTDLESYMVTGQDAFTRSSLLLLLMVMDWVADNPAEEPPFNSLEDTRTLWRLVVYSEYFSDAYETILIAIYQALKTVGPRKGETIVTEVVEHPGFEDAISTALYDSTPIVSDGDPDRLKQIKWSIYYGTAWDDPPSLEVREISPGESLDLNEHSWREIREQIVDSDAGFELDAPSEWSIRKLIERELGSSPSLERSAHLCAYAGLLLAALQSRYLQHFSEDRFAPHRRWFLETQRPPSARQLWAFPYDEDRSFRDIVTEIASRGILQKYLERLYNKFGESIGKSPQLMSVDADGTLAYERSYNRDRPNLPTLKYDRTADVLYELGWINTDSLGSASVTGRGRNIVAHFLDYR